MPLTKAQSEVLNLLAHEPRASGDIDIFHDSDKSAATSADHDAALLLSAGYRLRWLRRTGGVYSLIAHKDGEDVKLEWVSDSDFRFFPIIADDVFGYVLHPIDLATNKVMAAATRREVRDIVDLVTIHRTILPLGALIWAAVEKSPGFTPEGLIGEIRRNMHYPVEEWRQLSASEPIDPKETLAALRAALDEAEVFVTKMPSDKMGLLFLDKQGAVVQPDPYRLELYQPHAGTRLGHWPQSPDIAAALMERLKR